MPESPVLKNSIYRAVQWCLRSSQTLSSDSLTDSRRAAPFMLSALYRAPLKWENLFIVLFPCLETYTQTLPWSNFSQYLREVQLLTGLCMGAPGCTSQALDVAGWVTRLLWGYFMMFSWRHHLEKHVSEPVPSSQPCCRDTGRHIPWGVAKDCLQRAHSTFEG